jgi:hypothetical protein
MRFSNTTHARRHLYQWHFNYSKNEVIEKIVVIVTPFSNKIIYRTAFNSPQIQACERIWGLWSVNEVEK